jgi:hypothetical protein
MYGTTPPSARSGIEYFVPTTPLGSVGGVVIDGGGVMVRENV